MNIKSLKELLDSYGDHLEVLIRDEDNDTEFQLVGAEAGTDNHGQAIAILFASELSDEDEWDEDDMDEDDRDMIAEADGR